jgi:hypothetical protein
MPMAAADRVRIRELWFAYNSSTEIRAADPRAEEVLAAGRAAAEDLQAKVSAVLAEEADDPPLRAARDRAAAELRQAAVAAVRRMRALVALRVTDPETGEVVDQAELDRAEALADKYLPEGALGGLVEEGPTLQMQAGLVRDALAGAPDCGPLAARLTALLATHRQALERVTLEATELAAARKALEAARDRADRVRKAGWHYLQHLQHYTELAVDMGAIYPVSERSRARAPEEADAALDEAGAPSPAPEPAPECPPDAPAPRL